MLRRSGKVYGTWRDKGSREVQISSRPGMFSRPAIRCEVKSVLSGRRLGEIGPGLGDRWESGKQSHLPGEGEGGVYIAEADSKHWGSLVGLIRNSLDMPIDMSVLASQ